MSAKEIVKNLRSHNQWACWEADASGNEADSSHKAPRQPDATFARVNDPSTYSTFDQALEAIQPGGSCQGGGVGFIVTAGDPFVFIDLDHVRDPSSGVIQEEALEIAKALDTLAEVSPSGTGLHLIGKGRKPSGWGNGPYQLVQGKPGTIEVYDGHAVVGSASSGSKFLRLTGDYIDISSRIIREFGEAFEKILQQYIPRKEGHSIATMDATSPSVEIPSYLPAPDEIRCEIMTSDDEKTIRLMSGDTSDYDGDDSRADCALCVKLAYWCCGCPTLIDRVFRTSGLYRPKWDELRGENTYGQLTVSRALAFFAESGERVYDWGSRRYREKTQKGYCGKLKHNVLGADIIKDHHACRVQGGAVALWNGRHYEIGPEAIKRACVQRVDSITQREQNEVINYISLKAPQGSFDDGFYINFSNCVVDLRTLEIVEPKPSMFILSPIAATWDPGAAEGDADRFLRTLADGDQEVFIVLCEIIGTCICSARISSQAAMLIGRADVSGGEASNGKSTFINVSRALLGPENYSSIEPRTMKDRFGVSDLVGKLANLGDDISGKTLDGDTLSAFKKVITGDTLHVDVKYGQPFSYAPQAQHVYSMNEVPRAEEMNEGILRRLAFVPFRHKFTGDELDPGIRKKMSSQQNLSRLALLGATAARKMIEEGREVFSRIDGMEQEIEAIRLESDSVCTWLAEGGLNRDHLYDIPIRCHREDYSRWCEINGVIHPVSDGEFTRRIKREFHCDVNPKYNSATQKSERFFVPRKTRREMP